MKKKKNNAEMENLIEAIKFIKETKEKFSKNPKFSEIIDADERELQDELFEIMNKKISIKTG